jgi:homoserine kinase type II
MRTEVDDAANGLRGLRAEPSPALFGLLRNRYGFDGADDATDLGGSSNLNLLVRAEDGRYVVRVYRPYVTSARLADIQRVRRTLVAGGVPCSDLVTTRDGEPWILTEGRLVEVERYVEHDAKMDSWERLEAGLPLLGRIHTLLRRVTVSAAGATPLFANHVESHDTLDWTLRGTRRIRAWGPSPDELRLAQASEELAQWVDEAEREVASSLPRQLVHGDFWDNNVLFRDGRVALITDFDFMGKRARMDDLALTLYFANSSLAGNGPSDEHIRRLRRLVDAYDTGMEDLLTGVERAALPLAMARQPLWAVGRWLALLDDESHARRLAAEMLCDVEAALRLVRDFDRWQTAFT